MALVSMQFYSDKIQMANSLQVILPDSLDTNKSGGSPVMYLLAPESCDSTRWIRETAVERMAEKKGVIVIMLSSLQGCYTDMAYGYTFFEVITDEIPRMLKKNLLVLSDRREENFVAGISMGGMGALKWAVTQPEKFAAAASFSGRLDNLYTFNNPIAGDYLTKERLRNLWGEADRIPGSANDLDFLTDELIKSGKPAPKLYISCGTGDAGHGPSAKFCKKYGSKLPVTYSEKEGKMGWEQWDEELKKFFDQLPL